MDGQGRPAMEEILARYEGMQSEMLDGLEATFGRRPWRVLGGSESALRSGCRPGAPEWEAVYLTPRTFDGTYERRDWERAAAVVQEVGERHGFADIHATAGGSDTLEIVGTDRFGGTYIFGIGVNTVLGISTGCHPWSETPAMTSDTTLSEG